MKILILEDDEQRVKKFKEQMYGHVLYITHLPKQAKKWLEEIEFDLITLDHDLAEEMQGLDNNFDVGTGLEVANFIGQNPQLSQKAQILIHSLNGGGAQRMISAMKSRGEIQHVPFLWLKEINLV